MRWTAADGGVTYIQALEKIKGHFVPQAPRERNLLNIFARLHAAQQLRLTRTIFDIEKKIYRCSASITYDGIVPTMGPNAVMWSMAAGRTLSVWEMAKLMGRDLEALDLRMTTERQYFHMQAQSMHVASAGYAIAGLMAALGAAPE